MALVTRATNHYKVVHDNTGDTSYSPSLWHIADRFMKRLDDIKHYFANNIAFNDGFRISLLTYAEIPLANNQEAFDEDVEEEDWVDENFDDEDMG